MRLQATTPFLWGAIAVIAFPGFSHGQVYSPAAPTPAPTLAPMVRPVAADARVQPATAVAATAQPRPMAPAMATAPRPATSAPPPVQASSYWGPAKPEPPKRKPSALRRFWIRFTGRDEENYDPEQGVKVTRDMATGRTNILGSKPWMSAAP